MRPAVALSGAIGAIGAIGASVAIGAIGTSVAVPAMGLGAVMFCDCDAPSVSSTGSAPGAEAVGTACAGRARGEQGMTI